MDILRNPHYIGRVAFRRRARVTRVGTYVVQFRPDAERLERFAPELRIISDAVWASPGGAAGQYLRP
jgi:hypothetical protein